MAINETAKVVLQVNGKQAQKIFDDLTKRANSLRQSIEKAAREGNKMQVKNLTKQLKAVEGQMRNIERQTKQTKDIMSRLDKATPKELKKALKDMERQLSGIERGSKAWDEMTKKIRATRQALDNVNRSLRNQESGWDRFNRKLNDYQTSLMGIIAAVTGFVMAGRKAVNAYAGMEESLANTRKYTGLSADKVTELNEAFKKMDTRTPREELNALAQEAGRLGKNTLEDVQGYVEAADIINVALVDLGEGATQTIAKLTNIFGVEEMLGTKDAMLAVGSTVNVLSQNCTASKPYLVEFAQRMAGIGSQAGLTIPQILAFGAVLDANGQKVEMSATAIQKVIMNLANKNHEFAATLGMDAELLNQTLKHSAKDGLIMFLEALQKMGQDVGFDNATMTLAPAFKEMGLDAARVSQVLSTLAMHLDEVKWQMGEADRAFNEASSATREYEIFNNTAQASIDKAKKRVGELAIELGEKLYPVMKHIYTSSGIFLRALNVLVDFFIKYKREILVTVSAIATYNLVMAVYSARMAMATQSTALFHGALNLCKGVIPAVKLLITPLINTVQYFTNGMQVNYEMQQRWRKSLEGMKFSSWVGLILTMAGAVYMLTSRFNEQKKAAEEARKEAKEWERKLTDIDETSSGYCANEIARLEGLYKAASDEAKSKEERKKAAESLQKLYPDYFSNLRTEEIMVGNAKLAYDNLRESIIEVARARAAAAKMEENEKEILTLEQQEAGLKAARDRDKKAYDNAVKEWEKAREMQSYQNYTNSTDAAAGQAIDVSPFAGKVSEKGKVYKSSESAYQENLKKQRQLNSANKFLRDKYKISSGALTSDEDSEARIKSPGVVESAGGKSSKTKTDKFAEEKEWREQAEASARISYATGETEYIAHTKKMNEIAVEFYEKQLRHTDLTETERLQITAQWREAEKKQADLFASESIDLENERHNKEEAELKQYYADGKISKATYDTKMEELELTHLQNMVNLAKKGSEERNRAEKALLDKRLAQRQKHEQEIEALAQKFENKRKEVFSGTSANKQKDYEAEVAILSGAYKLELKNVDGDQAAIAEVEKAYREEMEKLKKKFGQNSDNPAKAALESVADWLNSDGGKAVVGAFSTVVSQMEAIFSSLTSYMQAELEMQTAAIEKKYDKEADLAQGNAYLVARAEKQKEKEIAQAKNEANRKMFAMQVIQAVAQTAMSAINAYSSAAAVPVVGYILAPIAAAMAVAAGGIQIAALKKQQQASEAQGYAEGGFTPSGDKYKEVGVVHAGEWVASQKLVNSPKTRPIINALEYAQRNNRVASLSMVDVGDSVNANMALARMAGVDSMGVSVAGVPSSQVALSLKDIGDIMSRLNKKLDDPLIAYTTITGKYGVNSQQERYERLISNKSSRFRG